MPWNDSWPVWCEIVCRGCANTVAGRTCFNRLERVKMRNVAKARGWRLKKFDGAPDWVCRECSKKEIE